VLLYEKNQQTVILPKKNARHSSDTGTSIHKQKLGKQTLPKQCCFQQLHFTFNSVLGFT